MSDREAMKLALKALDTLVSPVGSIYAQARIALRTRLAAEQPKQEHFAVLAIACKDKEIDRLTDENEALRRDAERLRGLVRHILGDRITPEAYLLFGKAWVDEAHAALRREDKQ